MERVIVYYRVIVETGSVKLRLDGPLEITVMTTTTRRTLVIVILVTVIMTRMNPNAFFVLRRANVVGRNLISVLIVFVAKENAMIVIMKTTIIVAAPPGVALVVKRAGS